jgi:curved DNA-binding protein CbpA
MRASTASTVTGRTGERAPDYYEVLGVNASASNDAVRAAYRARAVKWHPDRNPDDQNAEAMLRKLNEAFNVVGDPDRRRQYDAGLRGWDGPARPRVDGFRVEPFAVSEERPRTEGGMGRAGASIVGATIVGAVLLLGASSVRHGHPREAMASVDPSSGTETTATHPTPWTWSSQPDVRVEFPAKPGPAEESTRTSGAGPIKETRLQLRRPSGGFFAVERTEYPKGTMLKEQALLGQVLEQADSETHQHLLLEWDRWAKMGACTGRAFLATARAFSVRGQLCIRDSTTYVAIAADPTDATGQGDEADSSAFLDSVAVKATE